VSHWETPHPNPPPQGGRGSDGPRPQGRKESDDPPPQGGRGSEGAHLHGGGEIKTKRG
jgi:hypothetical protein